MSSIVKGVKNRGGPPILTRVLFRFFEVFACLVVVFRRLKMFINVAGYVRGGCYAFTDRSQPVGSVELRDAYYLQLRYIVLVIRNRSLASDSV